MAEIFTMWLKLLGDHQSSFHLDLKIQYCSMYKELSGLETDSFLGAIRKDGQCDTYTVTILR